MAGDGGDDFADEIKGMATSVIRYLTYASRGQTSHLSPSSAPNNSKQTRPNLNTTTPEKEDGEEKHPQKTDEPSTSKESEGPDRKAYAGNTLDAEFIRGILEQNNLEYSVIRKNTDEDKDIFEFTLPNRETEDKLLIHPPFSKTDHTLISSDHSYTTLTEMQAANPEVLALLDHYTLERALQDKSVVDKPSATDSLTFDFKTVSWDTQAEIMTTSLDAKGIPYTAEQVDADTVRFSVSPESSSALKSTIDHLIENTPNMDVNRFPDYEKLTSISPEKRVNAIPPTPISATECNEVLSVTVQDPTVAETLKTQFMEEKISFETYFDKESGHERFVVTRGELYDKANSLERITGNITRLSSTDIQHLKDNPLNKVKQNTSDAARVKQLSQKSERGFTTETRHTPTKDEKMATRSARARNKDLLQKSHSFTRGRQA